MLIQRAVHATTPDAVPVTADGHLVVLCDLDIAKPHAEYAAAPPNARPAQGVDLNPVMRMGDAAA